MAAPVLEEAAVAASSLTSLIAVLLVEVLRVWLIETEVMLTMGVLQCR